MINLIDLEKRILKGEIDNKDLFSKEDCKIPILLNDKEVIGFIEEVDKLKIKIILFEELFHIYYGKNGVINHVSIEK